jgi:primosomal protein N' (replication factor Y)
MRIAQVVPDLLAQGVTDSFTYEIPEGMKLTRGDAVLSPFGGRTLVGYIANVREANASEFDFAVKRIASKIDGLSLPHDLMEMLEFASAAFLSSLGSVMAAAMPPGVRSRITTVYSIIPGAEAELTPGQREALKIITEKGGKISERQVWASKSAGRSAVSALLKKGILDRTSYLPPERKKKLGAYVLASGPAVQKFVETQRRKPAQIACIEVLREAPPIGMTSAEIAALTGVTSSTVDRLIEAGILIEAKHESTVRAAPKKLTSEQSVAFDRIAASLREGKGTKFLLHGVTGSGKTEVYLRAVEETLAMGKQALYLVPEIALTAQVVGQVRERFGDGVAVMHSALAEGERLRNWRRAREGTAPLVIGARSAIFAPLANLGLVIVDEEHEGSYKQETAPRYHVRELAEFRAARAGATLILGSATPSLESYHRALAGDFELLELKSRAVASKLPDVAISDLRDLFKEGKPSILGPMLHAELAATLNAGEQAILFINRRAYSHSVVCRDCGYSPRCPNCSVAFTFHRGIRKLRCHHCDLTVPAPDVCSKCSGTRLRALGIGTEKVEEIVREAFPHVGVARLDRDVAQKKGAVEDIFARLREGSVQVLVGTQMIAKGLDFPNVTLVGVIAADTGLNVPDYRSTERTFQLLTQVAGRAGRRRPGRVVVQCFQPEHPAIRFSADQDYRDFYEFEIAERKEALYPPFVRLVNVICASSSAESAREAAEVLADHYSKIQGIEVVGPAECALSRLRGKYRRHLLLKLGLDFDISKAAWGAHILPENGKGDGPGNLLLKDVAVTVDVSPGSLM